MTRPSCSSAGLLLLLIGYAAAGNTPGRAHRRRYLQMLEAETDPYLLLPDVLEGGVHTSCGLESDRRPRAAQSSICREHTNLHNRLDAVEKRVENTVMKLEGELAALMEAIEAPQWRPLLDTTGKTVVDILEDPAQRRQS